MDEFDDLTCRKNPTLYIKLADIFALHALVAKDIDIIAPEREDQLRDLIRELGSVKNSEAELQGVSNSEIGLTLNPRLSKVEGKEIIYISRHVRYVVNLFGVQILRAKRRHYS